MEQGRARVRYLPLPGGGQGPRTFLRRLADACRGLVAAYQEEPNLRFHVFAATVALALARAVRLEGLALAYLLGAIALVLLAEVLNTAVERAVDLAAQGRLSPLAREAKDVAAGAVLIAAGHAVVAGYLLLVAPLGAAGLVRAVAALVAHETATAVALGALVVAAALAGIGAGRRRP